MNSFLENLSMYSVLLPLLTGIFIWKYNDANARIMVILMAFASYSQIGGNYLPVVKNIRYNLYTIADALFWSMLFYRNAIGQKARLLILILYSSLISYALINYITIGIKKEFFSEVVCMNNIIQVICVLVYFYGRYYNEKIVRLIDDSMFWFCLGILLYAPCTYFLFTYRTVKEEVPEELWNCHHVFNALLYIIITVGFLIRVKKINYQLKWI